LEYFQKREAPVCRISFGIFPFWEAVKTLHLCPNSKIFYIQWLITAAYFETFATEDHL
jgi:hypothetical protein